ncbi:MAG: peptide chain release factor N(5)-glutamine methyltransferase [Elusimicrobiota bacterium]|jgi:release factor glutamine methyltransferase|nr:peptide chain release factor N(5)-glutamine methyltransferase [Elusimicrobiota bacterium]
MYKEGRAVFEEAVMKDGEQVSVLLKQAALTLREAGIQERQAQVDAEILLSGAMGIKRSKLPFIAAQQPTSRQFDLFSLYIQRRSKREPTYYILGKCEFMGLEFEVNKDVLIPRMETEILVQTAIEIIKERCKTSLLDLCCGSGAIAISAACLSHLEKITAVDVSQEAISLSKKNAAALFSGQIDFILGNMFEPLGNSKFDILASNPPYIALSERQNLDPELAFEPQTALFAPNGGLFFYKKIAENARDRLNKGGHILVELNSGLSAQIQELFLENGFKNLEIIKDYSHLDRVLWIKS